MNLTKTTCLTFALLFSIDLISQESDSLKNTKVKENVKKGWNLGALPAIAYDADLGFRYGALMNLFNFGDGSVYPDYKHSIYLEWSRTTLGSGTNQFIYDSKYLIPNVRVTAEASLLTEQSLDFYGFNGYEAYYNPKFEDVDDSAYISRVYYRYDRKLARLKLDFQGNLFGTTKYKWIAGLTYFNTKVNTIDIDKINKGKSGKDILKDTALLYDKFVDWGFIPQDQKNGGSNTMLTLGFIYDTRDNEPNPMKGIWSEAILLTSPSFLGNKYAYHRIDLTHRQYFTIAPEILNFAYRLSYQAKLGGSMPFYMLPYFYTPKYIKDGLGGGKTLRGIKRNRIVGEDFILGNLEMRWKFYRRVIWKQNIYLALAPFTDFGRVTGKYKIDVLPPDYNEALKAKAYLDSGSKETWHISYGAGFYAAMNQNFIVAVSYGMAADKRDGDSGLYINLDFLF